MLENKKRIAILQENLIKENVDLAIIMNPLNIFYFTGFKSDPHERFFALVLEPKDNKSTLFVPSLDKESALQESIINNILTISDEEDPFEILSNNLKGTFETVSIESGYMTVGIKQSLESIFKDADYQDLDPYINMQRLKKSDLEISYLREAVEIIEKVLTEGIKKVKIGMTELELTGEFELLMKKFGAIGPSFDTIVLSGEKSALPHGVPGEREFEKGDFLLIDFGVITKKGYCSDMTRTFVIGEATQKQKDIYDIVLRSNQTGINTVKSNIQLKEIDLNARSVIEDSGYGEFFNNRIGHGLGIEIHEAPSIHQKNETLSQKGLFFTIEPGIYIPGYGGVRIEDEVFINEEGVVEVITTFPKELQIL